MSASPSTRFPQPRWPSVRPSTATEPARNSPDEAELSRTLALHGAAIAGAATAASMLG